jgi:hypothetical protein
MQVYTAIELLRNWGVVAICIFVTINSCIIGVFIARGKEDALVTRNMVQGDSVYGEKRISVEVRLLCFMI